MAAGRWRKVRHGAAIELSVTPTEADTSRFEHRGHSRARTWGPVGFGIGRFAQGLSGDLAPKLIGPGAPRPPRADQARRRRPGPRGNHDRQQKINIPTSGHASPRRSSEPATNTDPDAAEPSRRGIRNPSTRVASVPLGAVGLSRRAIGLSSKPGGLQIKPPDESTSSSFWGNRGRSPSPSARARPRP